MLRIGLMSEPLYRRVGMKKALKIIKELGFECADITFQREKKARELIGYFAGKDYKKKAKELKEYADKLKLPLVQAHAPFPSYINHNTRYNKEVWKKLIRVIEICGILKIKHLVIHPLKDHDLIDNINFYKKLLPYAKKANVIICTENMWTWNKTVNHIVPTMCAFSDTFNALIDGVNDSHLKGCVDIGHAEMYKSENYSARKMLEEMGSKRVVCLHIHDNDQLKDKHWIPFRGQIDFKDVAKGLRNINYKGDLIIEIGKPDNMDINHWNFIEGMKYLKEAYEAMKKIQDMVRGK